MDVNDALERLEQVRRSLSARAAETSNQWQDTLKYNFYGNVVDYYNPETEKFIASFKETKEKFDSWINELNRMQNEN